MINRIKTQAIKVIKILLKEGMGFRKVSLCIALGIALGIFPVLGATTLLCAIAAFVLRLNLAAIQIVNYLAYPLQLILLAPFYGAGSWLSKGLNLPWGQENLIDLLKKDFWGSLADFWNIILSAVFVWFIISPFLILLLYGLLKPVIRSLASAQRMPQSFRKYLSAAE